MVICLDVLAQYHRENMPKLRIWHTQLLTEFRHGKGSVVYLKRDIDAAVRQLRDKVYLKSDLGQDRFTAQNIIDLIDSFFGKEVIKK